MANYGGRRMSTGGNSLYETLQIPKDSSPEDIKRAYRKLALRYHPDKNPNNAEATAKFQEVNHANRILSDPNKRTVYDEYGSVGLYMLDQLGDEHFQVYSVVARPCFKVMFLLCGLLTGCYCCCCCCCCCNFCCGKCKPHADDEYENMQEDLTSEEASQDATATAATGGEFAAASQPVTKQPTSSGAAYGSIGGDGFQAS